jgi:hypothetical protein
MDRSPFLFDPMWREGPAGQMRVTDWHRPRTEFGQQRPVAKGRFGVLHRTLESSSDTSMRHYKGRWDEDRGDEFA